MPVALLTVGILSMVILAVFAVPAHAAEVRWYGPAGFTWPSDSAWQPISTETEGLDGSVADQIDFVGNSTYPGIYRYSDANYVYYRIRVGFNGTVVNSGNPSTSTFHDTISLVIDSNRDTLPEYAFSWDSKGTPTTGHGLEMQNNPTITQNTWGNISFADIDGSASSKVAPPDINTTGEGYVRTVDAVPVSSPAWDPTKTTCTFVDFAVKWSYLAAYVPALTPSGSWFVNVGSLADATDHNNLNADVGRGMSTASYLNFDSFGGVTLKYLAGANGSIVGSSTQTIPSGSNGTTVTATPSTGYHFASWSDAYPTAIRQDLSVTTSITVTANFAINTYTLTYTAGSGGTISGTSPQTVNYGSNGSIVTAVPDPGYHFVKWTDTQSTSPIRQDLAVAANVSATAEFAINTYTLTYAAGTGGTISGASPQTVNHGSSGTTVTAVPNTGYHFVNWSDTGSTNPIRQDTNVAANVNATANFAINTYTLTYTAGSGGTISGTSPQTVNYGSNGSMVTAVPNTGYHFVDWSDGVLTASRQELGVTADKTVTANFAINTYTLTYTAGTGGTISGTSPQTVNHGSSGTAVTANASTGYHFVNWSDSSTANPRTDTNVTANVSVTANFAPDSGLTAPTPQASVRLGYLTSPAGWASRLAWGAVAGATDYEVWEEMGASDTLLTTTSSTYFDVSGLSSGTHSYYVVATAGATRSADSAVVSVTFSAVAPASQHAAPANTRLIPGSYYDLSASSYTGTFQVTLSYDPAQVLGDPAQLKMLHYTGGAWQDVTTSVDTVNHIVYGQTSSFSDFGLGEPVTSMAPSTPVTLVLLGFGALALLAVDRGRRCSRRDA